VVPPLISAKGPFKPAKWLLDGKMRVVHGAGENHELRSSRDSHADSQQEFFLSNGMSVVDNTSFPGG
jgi:hypothetical protein